MQIAIVNGSVEYNGEPILSEINFLLHDKEKIAIVGRNGCGKTTLLKALCGEVDLIAGTGEQAFGFYKSGNPGIGYLKQASDDRFGKTMEEELLQAYEKILALEAQAEEVRCSLEQSGDEKLAARYAGLCDEFRLAGGYTYQKEYKTAAKKFGFSEGDLHKKLTEFSGGQRTKIALLKLLLSKPEVLLLDEPTNHLDLEAVEWLESYLMSYRNACVIVSHDRMFLDKIVSVVYEIEYGETKRYSGNYTAFLRQKKEDYEKALKDSLLRKREADRLSALVEKFRYKANKAKMAQAKLKQIERLGDLSLPQSADVATFRANFEPAEPTVENAVSFDHLKFGYGQPFGEVTTIVKRGEKVGIIGRNGCGKSTLVKTLMGQVPPLAGHVKFGLHANVGYFDQTMTQSYSSGTVLEDFLAEFPSLRNEEARRALGAFLFTKEDVFKKVGDLSGGEKVRLALCKIFQKRPNILVLDEPTNHMDIIGKETLENILMQYSGTVIVVSHDRYFINRVCNRLLVYEQGAWNLYSCRYAEYEQLRPAEEAEMIPKEATVKKGKPISESKERTRKLHRIEVLDGKMAVLEAEKAALEKRLGEDPSVYSDYRKTAELTEEIKKTEEKLQPLVEEWTKLMEETYE